MRALILLLLLTAGLARAQDPPRPDLFYLGVFADEARAVDCVTGPVGATFTQVGWAWAPPDRGLAYVTYRFEFPANLDLTRRPELHPLVAELIITPYGDGTSEWNFVFAECVGGWVRVFAQECTITSTAPGTVRTVAHHSMIRDCDWVLNDVEILGDLRVNEPGCGTVPATAASWGTVRSLYR